ncbi:MAG: response regulator [Desulfamplus sp.]|nr:response regulator [Desulfamplus sp.]
MKVLIVDDDTPVRKILSKIVSHYGHQAVTAENGQIGLDIFLKEPLKFDAILSDVMMPVMDGFELLKRVRHQNSEIPFVIMTGYGDKGMIIRALKQGATDFLTKPYTKKDLSDSLNRIESMLNTKQSMDYALPFINTTLNTSIPSRIDLIPGLIGFLKAVARPYCHLYGINVFDIATALSEAITNAIIHGNLDIPSSVKNSSWTEFDKQVCERESMAEYGGKMVSVCFKIIEMVDTEGKEEDGRAGNLNLQNAICDSAAANLQSETVNCKSENFNAVSHKEEIDKTISFLEKQRKKHMAMQWDIADNGKGFDIKNIPDTLSSENFLLSGRGILMIRSFMDQISWNSKGNCIKMVKYLQR